MRTETMHWVTLREWAEFWLYELYGEKNEYSRYEQRTIDEYRKVYELHIRKYVQEEKLEEFSHARVSEIARRVYAGEGIKEHQSSAHVILHLLLDLSRDRPNRLPEQQEMAKQIMIGKKVAQRTFVMRKKDISKLLTIEDQEYLILPITGLLTGMELSIQASLRLDSVNRKERTIHVANRMVQRGVKGDQYWREVSLQGKFQERDACYPEIYDGYLDRWLIVREKWMKEHPSAAWKKNFLFTEKDGNPINFNRFYHFFRKLREEFSVPVTMHGIVRTGEIIARDLCGANERLIQEQYGIFKLPDGGTR